MPPRCDRCGLPAGYPGADLDVDGICAPCRAAGERTLPIAGEAALRQRLDAAVTEHPYACMVAYSGGKDSTYLLARLASWYPGRILAFTYDTQTMSAHVWDNIQRVVGNLGVAWERFSPPDGFMRRAFRSSLLKLVPPAAQNTLYSRGTREFGPLCYACGSLCMLASIRAASAHGLPYLVTGFTPAQDAASQAQRRSASAGAGFEGLPAAAYLRMAEPMLRLLEAGLSPAELRPFRSPPGAALEQLRMLRGFDFLAYDETEVRAEAERVGFKAPPETGYGSTNCGLNPVVRAVYAELYGADKYVLQDAALVRWGIGRKEETLAREEPVPTLEEVAPLLEQAGTSLEELRALLERAKG